MLARLTVVFVALCVSAAAQTPPEVADCKVFKVWQFTNSAEGWRPDNNVGPFSIKSGVLSFTNTGPDPWIINASLGAPDCSKYGRLGIKMRSSVGGSNQVYFATDKSKLGEGAVATCSVRGDGKFHFYEIDLSQLRTWTGKLAVLRIDPVNGGFEVGAKVDIDWIALYQAPARIMLGRPEVKVAGVGPGRSLILSISNTGGKPTPPDMVVTANEARQKIRPIRPGETRRVALEVANSLKGYAAKARAGGKTLFEVNLMSRDTRHRVEWDLQGLGWIALDESTGAAGVKPKVTAAGAYIDSGDIAVPCALRPLATLVYRDSHGTLHYDEIVPDPYSISIKGAAATFRGTHKLAHGTATARWMVNARKTGTTGATWEVTTQLSADAPVEVLRFEGPRLWIGPDWNHALFPGLHYLEADEPYSAVEFIGPKLADQHIPHPYKVTMPVMALETNFGVAGMSWDPLQEWAPGHALPCAQFEPNEGLTIFAPSIPDYVDENHDYAKAPYTLRPGEKMTLKMSFFACPGRKITDVIPDYFAAHGLPKSPPIAGGVEGAIDTCFKAYAGTLYSKEDNGWKSHFGLHLPYTPNPVYASLVLAESLRKSKPELARKCNIDPNAQLSQYIGTSLDWFADGASGGADAVIARQSPDGGFPYSITEEMTKRIQEFKLMSGVDATTLGTVGETNSGLIARELGGILDYAMRTGEKKYVDAGLLGLAKLNSFTVPRGAQTWEVHAHAPDVYAAALCVNANIAGYHLTRDEKYLDRAKFWARTGLPFVYSWVPPISQVPEAVLHFDENGEGKNPVLAKPGEFYTDTRRQINPGSTIAVLGTSFYVANWFGTPVQWCGLVWANSVRAYTKLRPDPALDAVADSVFASATQQQFDKGFAAGTYPDSWNLVGNVANTAFIAPDSIISYAYCLIGEKTPAGVSTESFSTPSGVARLNTFASIEQLTGGAGAIEAKLKFYADQDVYACFAPVASPKSVSVDGSALAAASDLRAAASGYYYDAGKQALHVKYRVPSRTAALAVNW